MVQSDYDASKKIICTSPKFFWAIFRLYTCWFYSKSLKIRFVLEIPYDVDIKPFAAAALALQQSNSFYKDLHDNEFSSTISRV